MQESVDFNALGQVIDTTWGRTSTPKTASYSIKCSLSGDRLLVSFATIVNFGSSRQMIDMKRSYESEVDSIVAAAVKHIKKEYKEITGTVLKLSEVENSKSDSIEIINLNVHNAKRTAYYRRKVQFELS